MKEIKLFIASSLVEFGEEREKLLSLFYTLNQIYEKYGIRFNVVQSENLSHAVSEDRKQDEFNREIRSSRYIYFLVGRRVGAFTLEEFHVAMDEFKKTGKMPLIYTFFRVFADGTVPDESVSRFRDMLENEVHHFYSEFDSFDKLKLDILMELIRTDDISAELRFADGRAMVDGTAVMDLDRIPAYGRNDEIRKKREELARMTEELARLRIAFADDPEDDDLMAELSAVSSAKKKLAAELHDMEDAVLDSFTLFLDSRFDRKGQREISARNLILEGRYREANVLLKDPRWDQEVLDAGKMLSSLTDTIGEYIRGKRLLILNLRSGGLSEKAEAEIRSIYENACRLALRWQTGLDIVMEYGDFLFRQKDYPAGIALLRRLDACYTLMEDVPDGDLASLRILQGKLSYYNKDYDAAERAFAECLPHCGETDILRRAEANAELANIYWQRREVPRQAEALTEALRLLQSLAGAPEERTERYLNLMGSVQNRMGLLSRRQNRTDDAIRHYQDSLSFRERLGILADDEKLEEYGVEYTGTLGNLAQLYDALHEYDTATEYYDRSIAIRRKLALRNPSAFRPRLAITCSNMGTHFIRLHDYGKAEPLLLEAMSIREKLAAGNPEAYEPSLAITRGVYADLLSRTGRPEEAEAFFQKALETDRRLYSRSPAVYVESLSELCYRYGKHLQRIGDLAAAEQILLETIRCNREMLSLGQRSRLTSLANNCLTLANVYREAGRSSEAGELLAGILAECREAIEKDPAAAPVVGTVIEKIERAAEEGSISPDPD